MTAGDNTTLRAGDIIGTTLCDEVNDSVRGRRPGSDIFCEDSDNSVVNESGNSVASTTVGGASIVGATTKVEEESSTPEQIVLGIRNPEEVNSQQGASKAEIVSGIRNPEEVNTRQNTRQSAMHDVNDTTSSGFQDDASRNTTTHEHWHDHECDVKCDDGNTAIHDHGHTCDVNVNVCNIDRHMW